MIKIIVSIDKLMKVIHRDLSLLQRFLSEKRFCAYYKLIGLFLKVILYLYVKNLIKQYSKLEYNYSVTNNIDAEEINKKSIKWVLKHGLVHGVVFDKYKKINTALFSKLTYPHSDPNAQKIVQLGSDLISWLFLFDDQHGEGRINVGENKFIEKEELINKLQTYRTLLITRTIPKNPDPFHMALLDFVNRVDDLNPDNNWMFRFSNAMGQYFDGCIKEYNYRRGLKELNIKKYLKIRSQSIGAYPVFELVTLYQESNPYVIESKFDTTLLNKYLYHAALLCSWVNDIFSLNKEISENEANNLVMILKRENDLENYELAREKACDFNEADLNQLNTIQNIYKYTGTLTPELLKFLEKIRHWTIGNLYWTLTTHRYEISSEDKEEIHISIKNSNVPDIIQELFQFDYVLEN